MRLDRDAPLAFEVHRVEDLRLHLARLQRAGELEEPVREGRLAVVDVRDDGEVTDEPRIHIAGAWGVAAQVLGRVPRYRCSTGMYRCGYSGPV